MPLKDSSRLPQSSEPFCNRCFENFPVSNGNWCMGVLKPLSQAPRSIRLQFRREDENNYLCGNCYFDLTD